MVQLENLRLKPKYCTINELIEYCHTIEDCDNCIFGQWTSEFCPVACFEHYIDQVDIDDALIPVK